jgi:long-chain acyl-CoA synthetase
MQNFLDYIIKLKTFGSNTAFVSFDINGNRINISYSKLYELSVIFAKQLESLQIKPGDKVTLYLKDSLYWTVSFFGCQLIGAVPVTLDSNLNMEKLEEFSLGLKVKLVISQNALTLKNDLKNYFFEKLNLQEVVGSNKEFFTPEPGSIAQIVFTSGTTAEPKAVCLTHKNLISNIIQLTSSVPEVTEKSKFLAVIPIHSSFQQMAGIFVPLAKGAAIVLPSVNDPSYLVKCFLKEKISVVVTAPIILKNIKLYLEKNALDKPEQQINKIPKQGFQFFICGGSSLPLDVSEFWKNLGFNILEGYGLTECSPVLTVNRPGLEVPGSVGKALVGVSLKIENGEILAKGDNIFTDYYGDIDLSAKSFTLGGWFKTGDVGELSPQGDLFIKGRKADVEELGPEAEEDLSFLSTYKGINEACVFNLNNEICAVLVIDRNNNELIANIANLKLKAVKSIFIWKSDSFPKNQLGKIQKFRVKNRLVLNSLQKIR